MISPEGTHHRAVQSGLLAGPFIVHKASVVISLGPSRGGSSDLPHGVSQWRQSLDFGLEIGKLPFQ